MLGRGQKQSPRRVAPGIAGDKQSVSVGIVFFKGCRDQKSVLVGSTSPKVAETRTVSVGTSLSQGCPDQKCVSVGTDLSKGCRDQKSVSVGTGLSKCAADRNVCQSVQENRCRSRYSTTKHWQTAMSAERNYCGYLHMYRLVWADCMLRDSGDFVCVECSCCMNTSYSSRCFSPGGCNWVEYSDCMYICTPIGRS